jgi:hypothetical protein
MIEMSGSFSEIFTSTKSGSGCISTYLYTKNGSGYGRSGRLLEYLVDTICTSVIGVSPYLTKVSKHIIVTDHLEILTFEIARVVNLGQKRSTTIHLQHTIDSKLSALKASIVFSPNLVAHYRTSIRVVVFLTELKNGFLGHGEDSVPCYYNLSRVERMPIVMG